MYAPLPLPSGVLLIAVPQVQTLKVKISLERFLLGHGLIQELEASGVRGYHQ
jgi:hypothetical protein